MTFDANVPNSLKITQQWFASIITRPMSIDSQMNPISPSGALMTEEASVHITPGPVLRADQRIQIYNQQYWWRLLSTLQDSYPFVTCLFGYQDFNQSIGIPYLSKYPPTHWSLNLLGNHLPLWIKENYEAEDKQLIYECATLDWAYNASFCAIQLPPLVMEELPVPGDLSSLLDQTLYLQPHIHLFELDSDLFATREKFLKHDPDYWEEHDFPELSTRDNNTPLYFVLFRSSKNHIIVDSISKAEQAILTLFRHGASIDAVCQWLESQESSLYEEAGAKLHLWFQQWMIRKWLTLKTNKMHVKQPI